MQLKSYANTCLWALSQMMMSFGDSGGKFPRYDEIYFDKESASKGKAKAYTPQDVVDMFRGKGILAR